jgi:hypothetical protein
MPKDKRTYITVHDGMTENPKIEALSDKAFRCLVDLWCWCSRHLTDGKVSEDVWLKRTNAKVRAELLVGLVEPISGGVYMHDYLRHQRSREEVKALSAKRSKAGQLGGQRSAETRAHDAWIDGHGQAHA